MKKKICVYSCITGQYDNVQEFNNLKEKNIDYYLFTNNKKINSNFWKVVYIEDDGLDNIRLARKIKILGHPILEEYDITVWIDGASYPRKKISEFIEKYCDLKQYSLIGFKHPTRSCIYDEAKACLILGKESKEIIKKQIEFLQQENYPKNNGLIESAILVRNNHDETLQKTMKLWFSIIKKYSFRDQLSFNYSAYVTKLKFNLLPLSSFDNDYFGRREHIVIKENRLKKYRMYLSEDFDFNNYNYENIFCEKYIIRDNKYIIEQIASIDGNKIKLVLDNVGGIKINNITIPNSESPKITYVENIIFKDINILLSNNPTLIIETNYKKGDKIIIEIDMDFVSEEEYKNIIDDLYYKINDLKKIIKSNEELDKRASHIENEYQKLINSTSWKITRIFRVINSKLKKYLKGEKNEK